MTKQTPLSGVKVLDLTRVLSGPYCGQMLHDLGAEVLKIENPLHGDDSRLFQPFRETKSLYFEMINSGKKSITLNFKNPKAVEILKQLIKEADILLENFRPGIMEKFGLGYEAVKLINPRLIFASISGFGQDGPDALKPSYDILAQARGGFMSLTGYPDGAPVMVGVSLSDMLAGVFMSTAITTALYQRQKTNQGQHLDISMLDCQVAMLESAMMRYQVTGNVPKKYGCRHATEAPFQAFNASDRPFVLAAIAGEAMFQRLCVAIDCPEIGTNPSFSTTKARQQNVELLGETLQKVFIEKPAKYWIEILEANAIPVSVIQDLEEVTKDAQINARGMFVPSEDESLSGITMVTTPINSTAYDKPTTRERAPYLGEHTQEVLLSLGYDNEEIEAFKSENVI